MAQPPAYNRTKDFTVNFANETDHTALNTEFDAASNSINDIRDNLAIMQADDGKLRPGVITMDSISDAVYDGIVAKMAGQDISQAVLTQAQAYATTASEKADEAAESATSASESKTSIEGSLDTFFNALFPVGSIYQSFVATPPSYGTWAMLAQGVVLLSAGASYVAGENYGNNTHTITTNEMPVHTHTVSASSAGNHTHTRGTMNITGSLSSSYFGRSSYMPSSGALYGTEGDSNGTGDSSSKAVQINLDASRNWTGETSSAGEHSHTITCGSTGGGQPMSIMQNSVAVYIYRRTA